MMTKMGGGVFFGICGSRAVTVGVGNVVDELLADGRRRRRVDHGGVRDSRECSAHHRRRSRQQQLEGAGARSVRRRRSHRQVVY